jgi:hypothetical protein
MARPKNIKTGGEKKLLREQITNLLEDNWIDVKKALNEIRETDPHKYIEYYLKMIEYSVPKLRAVDTTINTGDTISNITIEVKKPTLSTELFLDGMNELSSIKVIDQPRQFIDETGNID